MITGTAVPSKSLHGQKKQKKNTVEVLACAEENVTQGYTRKKGWGKRRKKEIRLGRYDFLFWTTEACFWFSWSILTKIQKNSTKKKTFAAMRGDLVLYKKRDNKKIK